MPSTDPFPSANLLLAALSDADRARLEPHAERIAMHREQVLVTPDEPIEHVYFLEGGIASITAVSGDSGETEIGIFGREGVSGSALLLGADRTPHGTYIQVNGSEAIRLPAAVLTNAVEQSSTLRRLMLRYVQTTLIQVSQSAVANSRHQIESRLARWLLMCRDRVDTDEIALTHEFMGIMIGAQRSGVTLALHVLEGTRMIRSTRGKVVILDRGRLEDLAGDGYGAAEAEYRRLIGPMPEPTADPA